MEIPTSEILGGITGSFATLSRKKENEKSVISANTFIAKRSNYQQISNKMTHDTALQGSIF